MTKCEYFDICKENTKYHCKHIEELKPAHCIIRKDISEGIGGGKYVNYNKRYTPDNAEEFGYEMEDVLEEKFPKYKDSWKNASISELRTKMDKQIFFISKIITTKIEWDKEKVRRKLLHVANYCFFLYNRLGE